MFQKFTEICKHFLVFVGILFNYVSMAQVTSSSIKGFVNDAKEALPGATIVAQNVNTGAKYATLTRENGSFNLLNVSSGLYKVKVSFVGYNDTEQIINVALGEEAVVDFKLIDNTQQLDEVVVKADKSFNADRQGAELNISSNAIAALPTVNRNLSDFTRLTPVVKLDANNAVSIAGQNNRFNSIYIDGAVNNDVFGISASGTNGGQTGATPISIDAIEQFKILVSPYDVSLSGFTGGGINAVTRSGTNTFQGSVYYFFRNESLAGKTPGTNEQFSSGDKFQRSSFPDFNSYTSGFRLGGPLIKNKLFFFVNGEIQRDESPTPYRLLTYQGKNFNKDSLDLLKSTLMSKYGYDPGSYDTYIKTITSDKIVGKLDWNINDKHKLSISHRYTNSESVAPTLSSNSRISFSNYGIFFPSKTNSSSIELNSTFGANVSNRILLGYTSTIDDRGATGASFPYVLINQSSTGDAVQFGSDPFSTGNLLESKIFTFNQKLDYLLGKHNLSAGFDGEFGDFFNFFIRQNYGAYTYGSLSAFLNDLNPTRYDHSYSLIDQIIGDGSKAAADFKSGRIGFFAQDKFDLTRKFSLTAGIRFDLNTFPTDPFVDEYFNNTAKNIVQKYYDLEGALSGKMPSGKLNVSPRVGFNYDINGDRSFQIRGGTGIFLGRIPMVWPGGVYANSGVIIGGVGVSNPKINFRSDVNNQYKAPDFGQTLSIPSGEINLISSKFKLPSVWRSNLAFDKKLAKNWVLSLEGIFTKNINDVQYLNVNLDPSQIIKASGSDSRNIYSPSRTSPLFIDLDPTKEGVNNPYGGVFLLKNTNSKNAGYSYNLTAKVDKTFSNNLLASLAYTFGESKVLNEATSSQNSSQWRYVETVNGRNFMTKSYSDFDMGSRIVGYVSYGIEYAKLGKTTFTLFYNGQSGNRLSYVYKNSLVTDRGRTESNDLIFIPATKDQIVFKDQTTADQQWDKLNAYIEADEYLRSRRGKYAERNGSRAPFTNVFDFKILQDFYIKVGGNKHTLQLSWDVFNVGNLLNKKWGRQYFVSDEQYSFLTFEGFNKTDNNQYVPTFKFTDPKGEPWNLYDNATGVTSRWTSQLGIRYIFN